MTIGYVHEHLRELLIHIITAVASWSGIRHMPCGQATWQSEEAERGLEADLSYYFDPEKVRVATDALARESKDPADYPWPDLAVEIDISYPEADRARSTPPSASPKSGVWSRGRRSSSISSSRTAPIAGRGEPVPPHPPRRGYRLAVRRGRQPARAGTAG